jgi:hypothetical protein
MPSIPAGALQASRCPHVHSRFRVRLMPLARGHPLLWSQCLKSVAKNQCEEARFECKTVDKSFNPPLSVDLNVALCVYPNDGALKKFPLDPVTFPSNVQCAHKIRRRLAGLSKLCMEK